MIPKKLNSNGYLPQGKYETTWEELEARFGKPGKRQELLEGLRMVVDELQAAGCKRIYIDGSLVSAKEPPGDFDCCWAAAGVDQSKLSRELLATGIHWSRRKQIQKDKYGGEVFNASDPAVKGGMSFLNYFQQDNRGFPILKKGILYINLGDLT